MNARTRTTQREFKAQVCPSCGAVSVFLSVDGKTAICWQGHRYPNTDTRKEKP